MGGLNVKNTMIEGVLRLLAPHPCYSCGKVGVLLCPNCKYNITHEPFVGCILCQTPQKHGICPNHGSPIERTFVVGARNGPLEDVINGLKFNNVKSAAKVLAELLDDTLPLLPTSTHIVPIPTVRSHVRRRGYDQVELIARHFAQLRGLPVSRLLVRKTSTTQHTEGRDTRKLQAATAFGLGSLSDVAQGAGPLLLIDDIITTGATVSAAAEQLVNTGATVWVAALAYQPLD